MTLFRLCRAIWGKPKTIKKKTQSTLRDPCMLWLCPSLDGPRGVGIKSILWIKHWFTQCWKHGGQVQHQWPEQYGVEPTDLWREDCSSDLAEAQGQGLDGSAVWRTTEETSRWKKLVRKIRALFKLGRHLAGLERGSTVCELISDYFPS